MPYAQSHYPFENKRVFDSTFPADFIAEGVDQTRGWFYTLLVVSTILFNKPPYKNLIVNGLVLASNGQKMSKRLKNYPDPMNVVEKFGADALRLYLVNSPVVRAETLRFQEKGVKDVVKDVFLPWFNAYRFLMQNVIRLKQEEGVEFKHSTDFTPVNTMDRWIFSFTQSLVSFMRDEMAKYRLYTVVPRLVRFIDQLTNWYVRSNRKRIKGELGKEECLHSMHTLFSVLYSMTRMMAPFTPFLTEHMFQNLRHLLPWELNDANASLHYIMMPKPRSDLIDVEIERAVSLMQNVVEAGRYVRDVRVVPIKFPLPEVVVIHRDPSCRDDLKQLESYILEELNVKQLTLAMEDSQYGVKLQAEPDNERLGKRLKGDFKRVAPAIKALSNEQLVTFQTEGKIEVEGHELTTEDIKISYAVAESLSSRYHAHANGTLLVLLDVTPSQEMVEEGVAREVINKIQKLRKKAGLQPRDSVEVLYEIEEVGVAGGGASLTRVIQEHKYNIESTTRGPVNPRTSHSDLSSMMVEETQKIKGLTGVSLRMWIIPKPLSNGGTVAVPNGPVSVPTCRYVNLCLAPGCKLHSGGFKATLLLENPRGENILTYDTLEMEVCVLLKLFVRRAFFTYAVVASGNVARITASSDLLALSGQTLYITDKELDDANGIPSLLHPSPFSPFTDVTLSDGRQATVLLENPLGVKIIDDGKAQETANQLFL
jgi:isoleucyl-tRNA synthetase